MSTGVPDVIPDVARNEQLFLSEPAWAYFYAYKTIVLGNKARFDLVKLGEDPDKLLVKERIQELLKATLPHQREYIDSQEPHQYHYLLDEIEKLLLAELRKILEGQEAD